MKKRVYSLILALAMLCTLLPRFALSASAETYSGTCGAEGDNLTWSLDTASGLLTIEGSGAMANYGDVMNMAPWRSYFTSIKDVSLPDGLTSIGDYAFNACRYLIAVDIPNGVTSIGEVAFGHCEAMATVTIPDSVTEIHKSAFYYCKGLTAVSLPNSITSIATSVFYMCTGLTSVIIPDSVTSIGPSAFAECSSLPAVTIPNSVTSIEDSAFGNCEALTAVTIPDSVISIGSWAFHYDKALTSVDFGSGLESIGFGAFKDCKALTSVTIPDNVNELGWNSFENCTSLTSVTIGSGITEIKPSSFNNCSALTSVNLSNSVTKIDNYAFGGCTSLTSVNIPKSVTDIENHAFAGCSALTSVSIPNSVVSIGDHAFYSCDALTSVTIPASVASIGEMAFGYYIPEQGGISKVEGFTICGFPGTAAESYATENGFRFIAADRFVDVTADSYYFNAVMWGISHNPVVTAGVDETHFGANNPCTREQIVTFLWKAAGAPAPESSSCDFTDVQPGSYYYNAVLWAKEKGITSGVGNGLFGVGQPCTRAQAMTFLWVCKGRPAPTGDNPFTDVQDGAWYCNPIRWAVENHITAGMGDGTFGVNVTCMRAQIITFLYKAFTLPEA